MSVAAFFTCSTSLMTHVQKITQKNKKRETSMTGAGVERERERHVEKGNTGGHVEFTVVRMLHRAEIARTLQQ